MNVMEMKVPTMNMMEMKGKFIQLPLGLDAFINSRT